jgi:hypothetical protein
VAEQLQKNTEGVHAAGTSTAEGSSLTLTGGDVPRLDAELFEDPLLHPDQIACMLEYGRRFTEYTKVCTWSCVNQYSLTYMEILTSLLLLSRN